LRGDRKGTEVVVTIKRIGEDDPLVFHLIRDEIKVEDISYSGFVKPGIGLIRLARFSRNSGTEVHNAIESLSAQQGLKALIFDLRGNPGGLLDAAVAVADNFLEKGQTIVTTKGRWAQNNQEFISKRSPILGDAPLVILVDQFSASASEIVAGAVQDLDRGVIVGSNTFGKGLVQTVVSVDRKGEKQLKITTAKYFTPSGRLIQRPEVFEKGARSVFASDNEKPKKKKKPEKEKKHEIYHTLAGRPVEGGGGITPDVSVKNASLNLFEIELLRKSMIFNFSLEYAAKHPDLQPDFIIDDQIMQEFFDYISEKDFSYKFEGEEELEELVNVAEENKFADEIADEVKAIQEKIALLKQQQKEQSSDNLRFLLKREIAGKLWGTKAYVEATFGEDEVIQKAVSIIEHPDKYARILNGQEEKSSD